MKENYVRAHLFLSGRVQGVGMRFYVRSLASKRHLVGFVRNLPDGRVESILEGPRETIEKLLLEINQGEYANDIRDIECSWEKITNAFSNFEIIP